MKELLLNYAEYNVWANKLIAEILCALPKDKRQQEMVGSFPSIQKTTLHIWGAENIWLQRLQMAEHVIVVTENDEDSFDDTCRQWLKTSEGLLLFTQKIHDERGFEHQFHYKNIKNEHFKSKVWECLHHVFNHSTFHRGQLITYLRQLGITQIPSTDFITFCRKK